MGKAVNLIGQKFTRLLVVDGPTRAPNGTKITQRAWVCMCDCGVEKTVAAYKLTAGRTQSCGCLIPDTARNTRKEHPKKPRHNHSHSPTYVSWFAMLQRCSNPKNKRYDCYGGRGISVCEQWRLFDNFLADMGVRPEGKTLDRIDVNGNYEPANVRWATAQEQSVNKRNSRKTTSTI